MTPNPKKDQSSKLPEDERPTLPDIDVDDEAETLPRRRELPAEEIGSVTRPPADS
jgi:hypothetical protein